MCSNHFFLFTEKYVLKKYFHKPPITICVRLGGVAFINVLTVEPNPMLNNNLVFQQRQRSCFANDCNAISRSLTRLSEVRLSDTRRQITVYFSIIVVPLFSGLYPSHGRSSFSGFRFNEGVLMVSDSVMRQNLFFLI